jgi:2-oxoglutarate ferredoxin oxidoreductase subunit beta
MTWLKDNYVDHKVAEKMPPEKSAGKMLMGEFVNIEAPEYTALYDALIDQLT